MLIGTYRKNVMKTVAIKPAKLGLRVVSKNTLRTNLLHATVSLKAHTGRLMQSLSQYVLGLPMTQEMKDAAFKDMADISYDVMILCRALKLKMPASTKKIKLTGTRTAAILTLDSLTTDLLAEVETGIFNGPQMTRVTKDVVLPNKGGIKESREVDVVDVAAESEVEKKRQEQMRTLLAGIVDVYWRLSFDMFQTPPVALFEHKFNRMRQAFPSVEFDVADKPKTAQPVATAQAPAPKGFKMIPKGKGKTKAKLEPVHA